MQVKVTLTSEVVDRLRRRAGLERRSLAQMGGLLIADALAVEGTSEAARSAGMASSAGGSLSGVTSDEGVWDNVEPSVGH